jgi:hypothetical protein
MNIKINQFQFFWGAKRCKYHGFVLRRHETATSNSCQPLVHGTNLLDSFTTLAHGNIAVKRKHNYVFSLIVDSTNKNNKILMKAMEMINYTQLDGHNRTFKEHF